MRTLALLCSKVAVNTNAENPELLGILHGGWFEFLSEIQDSPKNEMLILSFHRMI